MHRRRPAVRYSRADPHPQCMIFGVCGAERSDAAHGFGTKGKWDGSAGCDLNGAQCMPRSLERGRRSQGGGDVNEENPSTRAERTTAARAIPRSSIARAHAYAPAILTYRGSSVRPTVRPERSAADAESKGHTRARRSHRRTAGRARCANAGRTHAITRYPGSILLDPPRSTSESCAQCPLSDVFVDACPRHEIQCSPNIGAAAERPLRTARNPEVRTRLDHRGTNARVRR